MEVKRALWELRDSHISFATDIDFVFDTRLALGTSLFGTVQRSAELGGKNRSNTEEIRRFLAVSSSLKGHEATLKET